ncbi:MAG: sigma-70 family RNA polymerase sigma factor [Oscillospiraceae bacterium]|nr:sigma-70 family RNA polymerase sigma factor [Oscillospiraceae bacterium]
MNKTDLTEYADLLLNAALYKCGNIADAQDLVQDTLLAALAAMAKKPLNDPKAWLMTVLNRKYYDLLRRKYNKPTVSFDVAADVPDDSELYEAVEKSDEAEAIRRCLAYLTGLYREVMVRYYMHGEKIKDIAVSLGISENTVKSRLDAGRKRIGKEFAMENYTKQSYEPEKLYVTNSGRESLESEPFSLVGDNLIAMNLLILAYEKPVTVTELAKAIGIATAYIEPVVDKLVSGELMKRIGDKVYTDFIIYTEADRTANTALEKQIADSIYKDVWAIMDKGFEELHCCDFYKRQTESQQVKLDSFFAVRTLQHAVIGVRDEVYGGLMPFEEYPDRPNGGKWFAMGSRYPANYDYSGQNYEYGKYYISGESCSSHIVNCDGYEQIKDLELTLCEYNTLLGGTQIGRRGRLKRRMTDVEVGQMLYAIHSGKEEQIPVISAACFENFDTFIERRYLANDGEKVVCAVPVITDKERYALYELSEKYDNIIAEKFHDEFIKLMKNPVKLPPHLKSVPEWQRYMDCCSTVSMRIAKNALDNGLFPKCADYPAPAILLSVRED